MAAVPPTSVGAIPGFLSLTASVSADLAGAAHLIGVREALRIAEHMHAVHQVNSWKCRILTLRLGEAHGVRVNNLKALNDGPCAGCCGCTRKVAGSFMSSTANRSFEPTTRRACSTDPAIGCCWSPRSSCAYRNTSLMFSPPILRPARLMGRRVLSRRWSWQCRRSGGVSTGAEERRSGGRRCDVDAQLIHSKGPAAAKPEGSAILGGRRPATSTKP